MKVRIYKNSIRVRLTQSEVSMLAAGQQVEQITYFSRTSHLKSSVESTNAVTVVEAIFSNHHLALRLPADSVLQWAQSDQVSIEADQPIDKTLFLRILIEKDFKCLHGNLAENQDAFPNPLG